MKLPNWLRRTPPPAPRSTAHVEVHHAPRPHLVVTPDARNRITSAVGRPESGFGERLFHQGVIAPLTGLDVFIDKCPWDCEVPA